MKELVLLHGWGMSSAVFERLRRELGPACQVLAMDLPGYGRSASVEPYSLSALERRVAGAAPPRCAVLGWSLGALIALGWAMQSPKQVEKLVIVAGTPCFVKRRDWPHGLEPAVLRSFACELESDRERTLRRFAALQALGDGNAKEVTRALGAAASDRGCVSDGALESGLRILRDTDLRPRLQAIPQPVLVIHGARDALVPLAAAEYLAANLPLAQLDTLSGAAHAPFLSDAVRVGQRILEFLDE
jgi:pimeloyl-[acyl-carrier protein] methyl ester esterase